MTEADARQLGRQTASEDFATRGDGSWPQDSYLTKLAQNWAIQEMFTAQVDVPTAKSWETSFLRGYRETYDTLVKYAHD